MSIPTKFKLHYYDTVDPKIQLLTTKLTQVLTIQNLRRVQSYQPSIKQASHINKLTKKDFLYVCVTGMPNNGTNQYDSLQLPGQVMMVYPLGFDPNMTQLQVKQIYFLARLQKQAQALHQRLKNRKDKPLVFIFHSFGTTIVSTLFRLYHQEYSKRVIGMIPIGCYTIRPDRIFKQILQFVQSTPQQYIEQNADQFFQRHLQAYKSLPFPNNRNKYTNMAYHIAFGSNGLGFQQMFSYIRQWYPILKCFIYGRQDNRLDIHHLNQTAIYYCHQRQFDKQYQQKIKKILENKYNLKVDNVQERFIYNIDGGKHSIHIQKKYQSQLIKIIDQYLTIIEETL